MQSTRQAESDPSCGVEEVLQFNTSYGDTCKEAPAKRQEQEAAAEATAAEGQEQEAIGEGQEQEQEAAAKKQEQEAVAKTQRQEQEAAAKRQEQERMRQQRSTPSGGLFASHTNVGAVNTTGSGLQLANTPAPCQ
jgi:FKBP-type peptidyl-prolyl cis-trans isomerase